MVEIKFKTYETPEEIKEAFARYNYFVPVNKRIVDACKEKFDNDFRPDHVILLKTERLYKSLTKTLNRLPSYEKNSLACDIRQCILNIRTHILRSADIHSTAISEAKSASCELSGLQGHVDLLFCMEYITSSFHYNVSEELSDIKLALELWFSVLK